MAWSAAWDPRRYDARRNVRDVRRTEAAMLQPTSPAFIAHAPAFADVVGDSPQLERVVDTDAHEGPVYVWTEHALYFTTSWPDVAIRRLALDGDRLGPDSERVTTVRSSTLAANGMALGPDGRLLVCEQGSIDEPAAITAVSRATGATETILGGARGVPLNSPNDVVVARDGAIWFTDPSYGFLQGFRPEPALPDRLYRYDPATHELSVAADGFDKPNGLAFSPDGATFYVGDNGAPHHLLAYNVVDGRRLAGRCVVAVAGPGHPDGIKVDRAGRIYISAPSGIEVLSPTGERLGEIHLPGAVNFTFGGPGGNVLFITADTAIWAAVLKARGD
jgi:gluconolactonase